MKTIIEVKGAIHGNNILTNKLQRNANDVKELRFNNREIHYQTKQDAKEAIKRAYKELAADEPDMIEKIGGIDAGDDWIEYDASRAEIYDPMPK